MGTSTFQAGVCVEIECKRYALLRKVEDALWQLEETRTKRIHEYSDEQLRRLYASGALTFVGDGRRTELVPGKHHKEVLPEEFEAAKLRRAYVMAVLDLPNSRALLEPAIHRMWERLGQSQEPPSYVSVYRWKCRFLAAGKDIYALVSGFECRGNRKNRYPAEVMALIHEAIESRFLTLERRTVQDTLDHAIMLVHRENALRPSSSQLPLPTRRLVARVIDAIPSYDKYAARHGRIAAIKTFRSVQAHRTTALPLERAEIDHTPLDLMVLDDATGLPLGRPWVTACIDDYTRCVAGIHVSFEPPSYLTVARCLKDAFRPKVDLKEKYPSIQNTWDAHGVMRELVVDNGAEFHSASLENACYSLGIEIHYSARKTPWFKGKIERFLGTLNAAIAHGSPGTTFRNIFDKEEYDPSKHAVIRFSKLQEIIRMWIVDVYHQRPHRTLNAPPAVVWRSSINAESILLPDDPAQLDAILGRSEERRLTHKGVELNGLLYNSPELTALRMKLGDRLDVEVRVDESDLGHIVVLSPDKTRMFKVRALSFDYANGLSSWQHRVCKRFAARELSKYDPASWLQAKLTISKLIDEEFMHKKQKTRARIARYKGDSKPVPVVQPETPVELPVVLPPVESKPAEPLTTVDISEPPGRSPRPGKKFKPLHRERLPHSIDADQTDSVTEALRE